MPSTLPDVTSHSLTPPSLPHDAIMLALGAKLAPDSTPACHVCTGCALQAAAFHTLMVLSQLAVTSSRPLAEKLVVLTQSSWAPHAAVDLRVATSHRTSRPSCPPVARVLPSGENAAA